MTDEDKKTDAGVVANGSNKDAEGGGADAAKNKAAEGEDEEEVRALIYKNFKHQKNI